MTKKAPADVFIQWQGTDVCLDFHCYNCNTSAHYDGYFAFALQCPSCGQIYETPSVIPLKKVEKATSVQHPTESNKESGREPLSENEVKFL